MQPKYLINSDNFKPGYVTPNDGWNNYWRQGQNSVNGWSSSAAGQRQRRQVHGHRARQQRAVRALPGGEGVQDRLPASAGQSARTATRSTRVIAQFKAGGYKMKDVFAQTAAYCKGN